MFGPKTIKPKADVNTKTVMPTVNATTRSDSLVESIMQLIPKKELNVPKRLQPRRVNGSRLMAAVASALVCCSTSATPPTWTTAPEPPATTCIAEPFADCLACGIKPHDDCLHLGFCPGCVFGTSVTLDKEDSKPKEVNIVEEEQMTIRNLKKGTKPLLTAAKRTAIVTNKSGILPHVVSQVLQTDLANIATSSSPLLECQRDSPLRVVL